MPRVNATPAARIQAAVIVAPTGCWEWQKQRDRDGYGHFKMGGRDWLAHRAAYTTFVGPIPAGLTIDHLCRNTACVNPAHLEPVTNRENILRGDGVTARAARSTHCPKGHAYDDANTWRCKRGYRHCRACLRASNRIYDRRRRANG